MAKRKTNLRNNFQFVDSMLVNDLTYIDSTFNF